MEHARAQLDAAAPSGRTQRRLRKLLLRQVIARPRVLAALLAPARAYSGSSVRAMAQRARLFGLLGPLRTAERQLSDTIGAPVHPGDPLAKPTTKTGHAILFTGCVMGELFGNVHRATARVLARTGVEAVAAAGQGCCGALHAHDGDIDFARELARRNIDGLAHTGDTPIVVNSAGCGAAMKEYGDLLAGDPRYAERARTFSARVKDATEFVAALDAAVPGAFPARVAYQDACHLAHAQRIREQPRRLLGDLEACRLVETDGADMCCGAAGIYSLVQPAMSSQLRARKAEQFKLHRPDVIATANPGCQMQYEAAIREAGIDARVMHVMEVLDEAQAAAEGDHRPWYEGSAGSR
jgi:glycolate oxidase iron-sulfur subunit